MILASVLRRFRIESVDQLDDVAILRMEQLYPLPVKELQADGERSDTNVIKVGTSRIMALPRWWRTNQGPQHRPTSPLSRIPSLWRRDRPQPRG